MNINLSICTWIFQDLTLENDMINALRFVEELENAGFTPEQAKKSVDTWMSLMNDNFATKSDFREFQLVSKAELREVQTELRNEIREVEKLIDRQTVKLGSLMLALVTLSTAILSITLSK